MFDHYAPLTGRYDELTSGDGQVRPHWKYLTQAMAELGPQQLADCERELRRLLIEHGITYNIYGPGADRGKPWALDLLPLIMTSREWREVEVGLVQRAELLRLILHDIYGPQKLIRRGLIPLELVFGDPAFLLPCQGIKLPLEHSLILYAADLGRAADGRLWVNNDRTQAPSGIGYALAARTVTSRVLPSIFRESNVHPILPFLRTLRGSLVRLAEDELDQVAVLTPGTANETWSEQAFLARQLGLPLVEGADLQVSGGGCYMLGTEGRQPVSALLRRMDDDYCDPLELHRKSLLGTPGLLQAVRNRRLAVANPLGAGVLENPALMCFLPRLCRELLGEELKLPSRDTWWCAREHDLWYVGKHFDQMIVRDIRNRRGQAPQSVSQMKPAARDRLLERIRAEPRHFVAQTASAQSTAPVLTPDGAASRPIEFRGFAVAANDSFRVMTGGLARAGRSTESWRFSNQYGGLSKDLWVLASEAQRHAHTLPQFLPRLDRPKQLNRPHVAENLIWVGRYACRAELLGRLLRITLDRLPEGRAAPDDPTTRSLLRAVTWQTTLYPGYIGPIGESALNDPIPELSRVIYSPETSSLNGVYRALNETVAPIRDLLTSEATALLNRLALTLTDTGHLAEMRVQLDLSSTMLNAFSGLLLRSLPETSARSLIELGFAIEHALGTVRMLRSLLVNDEVDLSDTAPLLLDLSNSLANYGHDSGLPDGAAILDALMTAEINPQSVRHQLMLIERLLRSLESPADAEAVTALEGQIGAQLSLLGLFDVAHLANRRQPDGELDRMLGELDDWLRDLANNIGQRYTPRRPERPQQLVETG